MAVEQEATMPYWRLFYHVVWSTKQRLPLIEPTLEQALFAKLGEKAVELGAYVHAIGGIEDHVHLALSVPPKLALADFIGQVKGYSSHFMHQQTGIYFGWQAEYGIVSFGGKNLPEVVQYIKNQRKHHTEKTLIKGLELDNTYRKPPTPK